MKTEKTMKKKTQTNKSSTSKLEAVAKDFRELVRKHAVSIPVGQTVFTDEDETSEEGFFLILLTRQGDRLSTSQFGEGITIEDLLQSFTTVIKGLKNAAVGNKDNIGIA